MPIFEVDSDRPATFQAAGPGESAFGTDAHTVVSQHLAALIGEQVFPVAYRSGTADEPYLLALDTAGLPVVVEVVQELDAPSVVRALSYAGQIGRLTRADIARRYHGGPGRFSQDVSDFYDTVPIGVPSASASQAGTRLLVVCARVVPGVRDALDFLRQPGQRVDILQIGALAGADGRRFLDVSSWGPATVAYAALGARPGLLQVPPGSAPGQPGTDPVPAQPSPRADGGAEESDPAVRRGNVPVPARTAQAGQAFAEAMSYHLPSPPLPGASRPASPASGRPAEASPAGPADEADRTPLAESEPSAEPTPQDGPGLQTGAASQAAPSSGLPGPQREEAPETAPTPAAPTAPATPVTPEASVPEQPSEPATPATSAAPATPEAAATTPATPAASTTSVHGQHGVAPGVVPSRPAQDDPRLRAFAAGLGGPVPLVWVRHRRGERFEAVLTPDGTIELADGRRFTHPDAAAASASGAEGMVDGWRVWRIGDDGPSLSDAQRA